MPTFAQSDAQLDRTSLDMLESPDDPEQVAMELGLSRQRAARVLTPAETNLLFPLPGPRARVG